MQTIYSKYIYNCEIENIEIYFEYNNSVIFSTEKKTAVSNGVGRKRCRELVVISKAEIEKYEGVSETKRYFRKENLVIQGIISFFTGVPLTVYHSNSSSAGLCPIKYKKQDLHLSLEEKDYTNDLRVLLNRLEEEPDFIISLLDRWRKAIYLKAESCDADLYYDESILSFFHILELFGELESKGLKEKLENNIEKMLSQYFGNYYLSKDQIEQMVHQNKRAVSKILMGDYLTLSIKVKHFLEKYELLDDNVAFFVDTMVGIRNAIAHGRRTYQKKFIWPLSPFFNLAKDSYENIEFLFFLTAEMIGRYIGIKCWEEEWKQAKGFLMPSKLRMESFLNGEIDLKSDSVNAMSNGNEYNITWRTIFNYYVKNPKKVIMEKIELILKDDFLKTNVDEENAPDIFNISLILADSAQTDIQQKAVKNIKLIIKNRWYAWSNFKDAYSYLDFYSVNVEWYKEFLDKGEYLQCK